MQLFALTIYGLKEVINPLNELDVRAQGFQGVF